MLATRTRDDDGELRGLVMANDAHTKRCHMLAARASRLNAPSLVVTNHDARMLPERLGPPGDELTLDFDRVLADVPCSGDGTIRKNPLMWKRWTAAPANMLHSLQLQIACKGVRLLRTGGRLAYSTCSLNPVENEAVVAGVLRTFGNDCVRLVDVSAELTALPRRQGLQTWQVWHRGRWHLTWASMQERFWEKCPQMESHFPPEGEEAQSMHLERCVRLMPHDVDGSGFFIAIFEKVGAHAESAGVLHADEPEICYNDGDVELPAPLRTRCHEEGVSTHTAREPAECDASGLGSEQHSTPQLVKPQPTTRIGDAHDTSEALRTQYRACAQHAAVLHAQGGATVESAALAAFGTSYAPLFVPASASLDRLVDYFGAEHVAFPRGRLVARSPSAKQLLLVTDAVLELLRGDAQGSLRVVHTGVRVFEREEAKGCTGCAFRACQDGLHHILPFLTRQIVQCEPTAAARILQCHTLVTADELSTHEAVLAARLHEGCQPGSVVLSCTGVDGLPIHIVTLYAPSGGIGHRVKPLERQALLMRLGVLPQEAGNGDQAGTRCTPVPHVPNDNTAVDAT